MIQPAWDGLHNFYIIIYTFVYMRITKCSYTNYE